MNQFSSFIIVVVQLGLSCNFHRPVSVEVDGVLLSVHGDVILFDCRHIKPMSHKLNGFHDKHATIAAVSQK